MTHKKKIRLQIENYFEELGYKIILKPDYNLFEDKITYIVEVDNKDRKVFFEQVKNITPNAVKSSNTITSELEGINISLTLSEKGYGYFNSVVKSFYINFFIGKMLKNFGFSLTDKGVTYTHYYRETYPFAEIPITNDPIELFNLLVIDYNKFVNDIRSMEEVFSLVALSPFFDAKDFENVDDERLFFNDDLKSFIKAFINHNPTLISKAPTMEYVDKKMPQLNILKRIEDLEIVRKEMEACYDKINGSLLIAKFNDLPKEVIGKAFGEFKKTFPGEPSFRSYVLKTDFETIITDFKQHIKI